MSSRTPAHWSFVFSASNLRRVHACFDVLDLERYVSFNLLWYRLACSTLICCSLVRPSASSNRTMHGGKVVSDPPSSLLRLDAPYLFGRVRGAAGRLDASMNSVAPTAPRALVRTAGTIGAGLRLVNFAYVPYFHPLMCFVSICYGTCQYVVSRI